MCSTCDTARRQPLKKALAIIAEVMKRKRPLPDCLDKLLGKLVDEAPTGEDALDRETQPLKEIS